MKLTYGHGNLQTQQGKTADGSHCITITKQDETFPVNSVPLEYKKTLIESEVDVILEFKTLDSARTLQDELNELISIWSKEQGEKAFKKFNKKS